MIKTATRPLVLLALLLSTGGHLASQSPATKADPARIDREYRLESTMTGYRGIGGEIDGVRNPTLWARTGDTVRITIVNGELMVHDIALEKADVKSTQILDKGATASITFKAERSDIYYCSVPGHRLAGMEGRLDVSDEARVKSEGTIPTVNGQPLNVDFANGTLDGWTVTGDAFKPAKSATGVTFAGSGGAGSAKTGTITSAPFAVTHPYASFLVSGGAFTSTRVELVLTPDDKVIYSISGAEQAALRPVVVDLRPYAGRSIAIRAIDDETGAPTAVYIKESPWAHINVSGFRLHESKPFFPNELTADDFTTLPPMDPVKFAGLSGPDAVKAMQVPPGFKVTLAAAEPDVVRPIAFAHDDRGRLWVAEAHTYPLRAPEGKGHDRILIFEDTNGDGTLDRRKVFIENLNLVSGIEIGFGGVWVGAAPYLLFIPVKDGSDTPAGPPEVVLDGWGYQDTHEMLNTFTWGPDGWLYGTHGVFTHSNVGKPGAPDSERQRLNGAIWRFHPTQRTFEIFAEGTSNPWGLDFNDYGHAFTTACVIEHLYHVIQGGRYTRQAGQHFNPNIYDSIKTVADHVHWVGQKGPHAGNSRSGSAGGGHAHAGAMIYLGGDGWPKEYRNSIFMNNIHGHRTNTDILTRKGSGYVGTHGPDFLNAHDSWSQMLNLRYGPDGSVHVIDWYDKNQCHSNNPDVHQKTLGRIFKISHASDKFVRVDLKSMSSAQLVDLQLHRNDWYVRHARRILQERGPDADVHTRLMQILRQNPDVTRKLRALWALHVTRGLTPAALVELLDHESEYVRSWAVYLLVEGKSPDAAAVAKFAQMAQKDPSPLVQLYLASALQRMPVDSRWPIVAALLTRDVAADHNLPLMIWYGAEPAVALDMRQALEAATSSQVPKALPFTIRRIAATGSQDALKVLTDRLGITTDPAQQKELVAGITQIVKP